MKIEHISYFVCLEFFHTFSMPRPLSFSRPVIISCSLSRSSVERVGGIAHDTFLSTFQCSLFILALRISLVFMPSPILTTYPVHPHP